MILSCCRSVPVNARGASGCEPSIRNFAGSLPLYAYSIQRGLSAVQGDPTSSFFPEVGAGGFSRIDSTIQFYQRVNALVDPKFALLDFGAGRGVHCFDDSVSYRRELRNFK